MTDGYAFDGAQVGLARTPHVTRGSRNWRTKPTTGSVTVVRGKFGMTAVVKFADHHLAHAASAYCTSGFDDATVFTMDGGGDGASSHQSRNTSPNELLGEMENDLDVTLRSEPMTSGDKLASQLAIVVYLPVPN